MSTFVCFPFAGTCRVSKKSCYSLVITTLSILFVKMCRCKASHIALTLMSLVAFLAVPAASPFCTKCYNKERHKVYVKCDYGENIVSERLDFALYQEKKGIPGPLVSCPSYSDDGKPKCSHPKGKGLYTWDNSSTTFEIAGDTDVLNIIYICRLQLTSFEEFNCSLDADDDFCKKYTSAKPTSEAPDQKTAITHLAVFLAVFMLSTIILSVIVVILCRKRPQELHAARHDSRTTERLGNGHTVHFNGNTVHISGQTALLISEFNDEQHRQEEEASTDAPNPSTEHQDDARAAAPGTPSDTTKTNVSPSVKRTNYTTRTPSPVLGHSVLVLTLICCLNHSPAQGDFNTTTLKPITCGVHATTDNATVTCIFPVDVNAEKVAFYLEHEPFPIQRGQQEGVALTCHWVREHVICSGNDDYRLQQDSKDITDVAVIKVSASSASSSQFCCRLRLLEKDIHAEPCHLSDVNHTASSNGKPTSDTTSAKARFNNTALIVGVGIGLPLLCCIIALIVLFVRYSALKTLAYNYKYRYREQRCHFRVRTETKNDDDNDDDDEEARKTMNDHLVEERDVSLKPSKDSDWNIEDAVAISPTMRVRMSYVQLPEQRDQDEQSATDLQNPTQVQSLKKQNPTHAQIQTFCQISTCLKNPTPVQEQHYHDDSTVSWSESSAFDCCSEAKMEYGKPDESWLQAVEDVFCSTNYGRSKSEIEELQRQNNNLLCDLQTHKEIIDANKVEGADCLKQLILLIQLGERRSKELNKELIHLRHSDARNYTTDHMIGRYKSQV